VARERPINAEVPAKGSEGKGAKRSPKLPKPPKRRGPRRPVPLPLKLVGGAILFAVVFIVAAILGSGGGDSIDSAAPPVGGSDLTKESGAPPQQSTTELGYPAFATKNTTRVGGDGAAANAAGAALAVFPATDESQRPAAVTLVDEASPAAAIAAAVLMAEPVRAPILISGEDEIPEESVEALRAFDPQGSASTGGAAVFAIGSAGAPAGLRSTRVKGRGAAATAAAIMGLRERLAGSPPSHIVVAPAGRLGFAMPAAAWAARSGDPVLYAGRDKLPAATARALRRHSKVPAYVLGPSSAISSDVLRAIGKIAPSVHRVAGEDPVENAIALARYGNDGFGWNVNDPGHGFVVARSDEPLDAAAASPLSAAGTWGPLLLTDDAGTLPAALRGYLLDVKPGYTDDPTRAFYNHVWVIGDQEAIEVGQQAEIDGLAELAKIGGK
jgi:Cell wall binding domain 2 (CWB2)